MRYGRAGRQMQLALLMQSSSDGVSIEDIMQQYGVSRRTAFRMVKAVGASFPGQIAEATFSRVKRWRLEGEKARLFADVSADELATLQKAVSALERDSLPSLAAELRQLEMKLRARTDPRTLSMVEPDLEALLEAEGIAHRPGPRLPVSGDTIAMLREAIKSSRRVRFSYRSPRAEAASADVSARVVAPLGLLLGHRHYLVADQEDGAGPRMFSLPGISGLTLLNEGFVRDPGLALRDLIGDQFGVFREPAEDVVWRFRPDAATLAAQHVFHPSQTQEIEADGSLVVRFRAGGVLEMAWYLMSWGRSVEVLAPESLKRLLPDPMPEWPALP